MLDNAEMVSAGPLQETTEEVAADYLSSRDALRILQVKPQTLYSYVSRGLIRRRIKPGHRTSSYNREDVHRLKSRSLARSGHGPAAASAMYWGEPVLESAITEITSAGPRYRDYLAVDLARNHRSFESVAEYLWTGHLPASACGWTNAPVPAALISEFQKVGPYNFRHVLTQSIALLAATWSCDRRLRRLPCPPGSIIRVMAGTFGYLGPKRRFMALSEGESIAHGLARVSGARTSPDIVNALDAALVLLADHELTTPTFVARIAASAGCDLPSCVLAALQVHFGSEFGLCCDRLEALFKTSPIDLTAEALATLRRSTSGFDNPLYSEGDPRANYLLELARTLEDKPGGAAKAMKIITAHFPAVQSRINLCEALVLICRALGLPHQVAGGLIALARSAGCAAHVFEQRSQNAVIRPRGKFVRSAV